jgi:serine/threonine-protein kinase
MSQPSWIGYKLNNRYEIEQELGSGGMSAVYKATDPNLKRIVAIKLIHPHLSKDTEFVRRFEVEAAAVAQLRHPNIVQVYDFDHDGDTYYMVLEFVPGESLQQRLKRFSEGGRKQTVSEIISISSKICDAVDYAHKRGLVHRDIKPANVMINVQDEPVLMDFGIVKIVGEKQHTATGAVVGTALYMSPEQIRGERPDHRADIYSLGVMLYEMLNGRPPFEADSAMTIMMMHLHDPIPDVLSLAPGTPAGFKTIIERALAKDPNQRYQSAGEMAAAIRQALTAPTAQSAGTMVEASPAHTAVETPRVTAAPEATYIEPAAPRPAAPQGTVAPAGARASGGRAAPPPAKKGINRTLLLGGGAAIILLLLCVIAGAIALPGLLNGSAGTPTGIAAATEPGGGAAAAAVTETPPGPTNPPATDTPPPPTDTPAPTDTPTITPTPTATTPTGPFVLITGIQVDGGVYLVTYEVFNFDPVVSTTAGTMHIHFFWNSFDPLTVGINGIGDSTGGGSWLLYDKPSPFRQFAVSSRPANATALCALVAFHDHSISLNTGNCFDLP